MQSFLAPCASKFPPTRSAYSFFSECVPWPGTNFRHKGNVSKNPWTLVLNCGNNLVSAATRYNTTKSYCFPLCATRTGFLMADKKCKKSNRALCKLMCLTCVGLYVITLVWLLKLMPLTSPAFSSIGRTGVTYRVYSWLPCLAQSWTMWTRCGSAIIKRRRLFYCYMRWRTSV